MATLSRHPQTGTFRLQFEWQGVRKTLFLPATDRKSAETIRVHIEHLIAARIAGLPLPSATAGWLADIDPKFRDKLARHGLTEPAGPSAPALGQFLEDYLQRQTHVKPASLLAVKQVVRNLLDYFGPDCRLSDITPGRADDFRKWLLSDGRSHRQPNRPRRLSAATVAKRLQRAEGIFADALRRKLIPENPFAGLKRPLANNRERQAYVPAGTIERLIEHFAPNAEWRLLLAMARYLGVRVPSEPFSMTWDCVLWDEGKLRVPSPKTAVHGKSFRVVPLLPQVRRHLEDVFAQAPEGSTYIFHRLRQRESVRAAERGFWANLNLRQGLTNMLRRAGIKPWPRLWHNLRASAQTDLANHLPGHVVCEWLGNTAAVAKDHYLQVTEEHFEAALRCTQNCTQQTAERNRSELNTAPLALSQNPSFSAVCYSLPDSAQMTSCGGRI